MRLSPERAKELRSKGHRINAAKIVRPERQAEKQPDVVAPPAVVSPAPNTQGIEASMLKGMIAVMEANERNTAGIIGLMAEQAKPKPKRSFRHIVTRRQDGRIEFVDTKEM